MDTHGVRPPRVKNGCCKVIIHKTSFSLNTGDVYTSHGPRYTTFYHLLILPSFEHFAK